MSDKPPFDPIRFACWLLAGVLGFECIVVAAAAVACLVHAEVLVTDPTLMCDPKDRIMTLLNGALATALALLAGFRGPPPPPTKPGG
jgi:hypothetical protein